MASEPEADPQFVDAAMDLDETEELETDNDVFDNAVTKEAVLQMRKASKTPSEWLKLLCRDWALQNADLVDACDTKFLEYKPYLKGYLTSQLLCRLSIPPKSSSTSSTESSSYKDLPIDFWGILGIADDFDKNFIISQIERFCTLYLIRGGSASSGMGNYSSSVDAALNTMDLSATEQAAQLAAAVAAGIPNIMDPQAAAAAANIKLSASSSGSSAGASKKKSKSSNSATKLTKEQRRVSQERKTQKQKERDAQNNKKLQERLTREASRDERRRKKIEQRQQREQFALDQKQAALKRAAALVASNRVPIELTRGAAAAKAAANAAIQQATANLSASADKGASGADGTAASPPQKKRRSAIVVSTAGDLHQIVTHSKALFAKYSAIAKEHNQKMNWHVVARELGIHVKVREKYARMHARAEQRGFDWAANASYKLRDYPEIFMEPTEAEQKSKIPPIMHEGATTVVLVNDNTSGGSSKDGGVNVTTDDAAVAAAAAVVDAAGVAIDNAQTEAALGVADPTATTI